MRVWIERLIVMLVAVFLAAYGGDWAIYKLRGAPQATVTVNRYLIVPLKGNKQEFDYQGSVDQPCARSLFAQGSEDPCWQLRRHTTQTTAP